MGARGFFAVGVVADQRGDASDLKFIRADLISLRWVGQIDGDESVVLGQFSGDVIVAQRIRMKISASGAPVGRKEDDGGLAAGLTLSYGRIPFWIAVRLKSRTGMHPVPAHTDGD